VLYEISNESHSQSVDWQYHMIEFIKQYESRKPKQHPVGMTAIWRGGHNADLFRSPADWISPNGPISEPPIAAGSKVIIDDTDHLCGLCGNGVWVWKSFLRGRNPAFMDVFDGMFTIEPAYDVNDPRWLAGRRNMGYTLTIASLIDMASMRPRPELASSGYCLGSSRSDQPAYLALATDGRLTLKLAGPDSTLIVEWLSIETGAVAVGDTVRNGHSATLSSPYSGASIAFLRLRNQPGFPVISAAPSAR
jgi:hypothetical protein